jgi:hypothetical protein
VFPVSASGASSSPWERGQTVYITEGEAENREIGLTLEQRFDGLTGRVQGLAGRLNGRYAATIPGEPLWTMSDGELDYVVATLSGSTDRSGTELLVEWRSLASAGSELGLLTIHFAQELPFIRLGDTRWRFLMACQNVLQEEGTGEAVGLSPLLDAESRLSGGVSVQF